METLEEKLAHYGIKGMHWGIRRANPSHPGSGSPAVQEHKGRPVVVTTQPGKGIKKVEGGQLHKPSEDAVASAAYRRIAKASTIDALSNKEIKSIVTRMQLETQYREALAKQQPKGLKGFIGKLLKDTGKSEMNAIRKGQKGPVLSKLEDFMKSETEKSKQKANQNRAKTHKTKSPANTKLPGSGQYVQGWVV